MKTKDLQKEAASLLRCGCGRVPCIVKHRGKYMITCPAIFDCEGAPATGWYPSLMDAEDAWNQGRADHVGD